jgi:hypothetical protein
VAEIRRIANISGDHNTKKKKKKNPSQKKGWWSCSRCRQSLNLSTRKKKIPV